MNVRTCHGEIYSGLVNLSGLNLEEIGSALADQTDYEHRWLISPQTGETCSGQPTPASTARHQLTSMNWI